MSDKNRTSELRQTKYVLSGSTREDINGKDMEKIKKKMKSIKVDIYSRKTQGCVFQLFTVLLIKKISCHTELNFKRKFLLFLNVVKIKLEIF